MSSAKWKHRGNGGSTARSHNNDNDLNDISLEYSFEELRHATDNFSAAAKIGQGAYGNVFKGTLADGNEVAVKYLHSNSQAAGFEEEVKVLSKFRHQNLVILMGFARNGPQRLLVYELLAGGDVGTRLQKGPPLSWRQRVNIALDAACGLSHLHNQSPKVYHRDIKSANILLDRNGTAKWGDFGLACLSAKLSQKVNHTAGTVGYADPTYISTATVTESTEVYSFGWVLIELLTAKPPAIQHKGGQISYFLSKLKDPQTGHASLRNLLHYADLSANFPTPVKTSLAKIALRCITTSETLRPDFRCLVGELRGLVGECDAVYGQRIHSNQVLLCNPTINPSPAFPFVSSHQSRPSSGSNSPPKQLQHMSPVQGTSMAVTSSNANNVRYYGNPQPLVFNGPAPLARSQTGQALLRNQHRNRLPSSRSAVGGSIGSNEGCELQRQRSSQLSVLSEGPVQANAQQFRRLSDHQVSERSPTPVTQRGPTSEEAFNRSVVSELPAEAHLNRFPLRGQPGAEQLNQFKTPPLLLLNSHSRFLQETDPTALTTREGMNNRVARTTMAPQDDRLGFIAAAQRKKGDVLFLDPLRSNLYSPPLDDISGMVLRSTISGGEPLLKAPPQTIAALNVPPLPPLELTSPRQQILKVPTTSAPCRDAREIHSGPTRTELALSVQKQCEETDKQFPAKRPGPEDRVWPLGPPVAAEHHPRRDLAEIPLVQRQRSVAALPLSRPHKGDISLEIMTHKRHLKSSLANSHPRAQQRDESPPMAINSTGESPRAALRKTVSLTTSKVSSRNSSPNSSLPKQLDPPAGERPNSIGPKSSERNSLVQRSNVQAHSAGDEKTSAHASRRSGLRTEAPVPVKKSNTMSSINTVPLTTDVPPADNMPSTSNASTTKNAPNRASTTKSASTISSASNRPSTSNSVPVNNNVPPTVMKIASSEKADSRKDSPNVPSPQPTFNKQQFGRAPSFAASDSSHTSRGSGSSAVGRSQVYDSDLSVSTPVFGEDASTSENITVDLLTPAPVDSSRPALRKPELHLSVSHKDGQLSWRPPKQLAESVDCYSDDSNRDARFSRRAGGKFPAGAALRNPKKNSDRRSFYQFPRHDTLDFLDSASSEDLFKKAYLFQAAACRQSRNHVGQEGTWSSLSSDVTPPPPKPPQRKTVTKQIFDRTPLNLVGKDAKGTRTTISPVSAFNITQRNLGTKESVVAADVPPRAKHSERHRRATAKTSLNSTSPAPSLSGGTSMIRNSVSHDEGRLLYKSSIKVHRKPRERVTDRKESTDRSSDPPKRKSGERRKPQSSDSNVEENLNDKSRTLEKSLSVLSMEECGMHSAIISGESLGTGYDLPETAPYTGWSRTIEEDPLQTKLQMLKARLRDDNRIAQLNASEFYISNDTIMAPETAFSEYAQPDRYSSFAGKSTNEVLCPLRESSPIDTVSCMHFPLSTASSTLNPLMGTVDQVPLPIMSAADLALDLMDEQHSLRSKLADTDVSSRWAFGGGENAVWSSHHLSALSTGSTERFSRFSEGKKGDNVGGRTGCLLGSFETGLV